MQEVIYTEKIIKHCKVFFSSTIINNLFFNFLFILNRKKYLK